MAADYKRMWEVLHYKVAEAQANADLRGLATGGWNHQEDRSTYEAYERVIEMIEEMENENVSS